ncbi:hypothetical protein FPZ43_17425 [Mucilaginibacter pallidiroseus]|uniref:Uncharacterized protein n=1 Tax=Mucilaginibacter pallidiroseus TaxID=2599295 RepID=A0A563U1H1_9SPHI|nr:hypothetical protein [Mucilaginibacter pallidiroseus]TWR25250.1 hypothetical protein FPZ43_17425 [Mucilaginibacter pallidiroseus]
MELPDSVKDVYDEIKDRLTSPFFGSFFIAWLIINWYIPISLIFYDQKELHNDNFRSFREVINSQLDLCRNVIWPLLCAFGYVLISPAIKAAINIYQTQVAVFSDNKITEILKKKSGIAAELKIKDELINLKSEQNSLAQSQIKELNSKLDSQDQEIPRLQSEVDRLQIDVNKLVDQNDINNKINELTTFVGVWIVNFSNSEGPIEETWDISLDGSVHVNNRRNYMIHRIIGHDNNVWLNLGAQGHFNTGYKSHFVFFLTRSNSNTVVWQGVDLLGETVMFQKNVYVLKPVGDNQ